MPGSRNINPPVSSEDATEMLTALRTELLGRIEALEAEVAELRGMLGIVPEPAAADTAAETPEPTANAADETKPEKNETTEIDALVALMRSAAPAEERTAPAAQTSEPPAAPTVPATAPAYGDDENGNGEAEDTDKTDKTEQTERSAALADLVAALSGGEKDSGTEIMQQYARSAMEAALADEDDGDDSGESEEEIEEEVEEESEETGEEPAAPAPIPVAEAPDDTQISSELPDDAPAIDFDDLPDFAPEEDKSDADAAPAEEIDIPKIDESAAESGQRSDDTGAQDGLMIDLGGLEFDAPREETKKAPADDDILGDFDFDALFADAPEKEAELPTDFPDVPAPEEESPAPESGEKAEKAEKAETPEKAGKNGSAVGDMMNSLEAIRRRIEKIKK